MKRLYEFTETGEFRSLSIPPEHKKSTDPGATFESLSTLVIEAVPPTWRDIWAIFRKRYQTRIKLRLQGGVQATDLVLRQTWTSERLEEGLYNAKPLLDALKSTEHS